LEFYCADSIFKIAIAPLPQILPPEIDLLEIMIHAGDRLHDAHESQLLRVLDVFAERENALDAEAKRHG
jgi:hypothetical protein